jgi:hypothetical protein
MRFGQNLPKTHPLFFYLSLFLRRINAKISPRNAGTMPITKTKSSVVILRKMKGFYTQQVLHRLQTGVLSNFSQKRKLRIRRK